MDIIAKSMEACFSDPRCICSMHWRWCEPSLDRRPWSVSPVRSASTSVSRLPTRRYSLAQSAFTAFLPSQASAANTHLHSQYQSAWG